MECGHVVHAHTCTDEQAHITEDTKLNTHPQLYLYAIYPDTCAHT